MNKSKNGFFFGSFVRWLFVGSFKAYTCYEKIARGLWKVCKRLFINCDDDVVQSFVFFLLSGWKKTSLFIPHLFTLSLPLIFLFKKICFSVVVCDINFAFFQTTFIFWRKKKGFAPPPWWNLNIVIWLYGS